MVQHFGKLNDDIDKCHTLILRNALRVKVTKDPIYAFCYEFFMIFVTQVYNSPEIAEQESTYNHKVIWRFIDIVKRVTPYCKFIPGETRLQAIEFELESQGLSLSIYYNAENILFDKSCDMELALLETTGPFGLKDVTRETTDHVKAAYGVMAMLHKVVVSYIYVDADIFLKLKVCFIHAAESAVSLVNHVDSKEEFEGITNMMWELKTSIDYYELLQEIKKYHEKTKQLMEVRLNGHEKVRRLDHLLADNVKVKLSSRVSEADDIYVYSSPLCPDSPYNN